MSNNKQIKKIDRDTYTLLLSENPCDLFTYFNVVEMHGLNYTDCMAHVNTKDDSYICGLANYIHKKNGNYKCGDARFIFINLLRCNDSLNTFALIMHEMMHHSFELHNYNLHLEEDIISWAEKESHEIYKIIKQKIQGGNK